MIAARLHVMKLVIQAAGETFHGEIWPDSAGFASDMPDGANRDWAEAKAWELVQDRRLSSVEDAENLRGVALVGHGFCLTALTAVTDDMQ